MRLKIRFIVLIIILNLNLINFLVDGMKIKRSSKSRNLDVKTIFDEIPVKNIDMLNFTLNLTKFMEDIRDPCIFDSNVKLYYCYYNVFKILPNLKATKKNFNCCDYSKFINCLNYEFLENIGHCNNTETNDLLTKFETIKKNVKCPSNRMFPSGILCIEKANVLNINSNLDSNVKSSVNSINSTINKNLDLIHYFIIIINIIIFLI